MLSIQQLIKALRKLQNNTTNGGDLVKSIKHVAASASVAEGIPATTAPNGTVGPTTLMTSLLNNNNHSEDVGEELLLLQTTMTKKTSSLPKQPQQQQQQQTNASNNSCGSHDVAASTYTSWSNNNENENNTTSSQRRQTLDCHTAHNECFSLYSPLDADGSKYSCGTENSTTQDSSVNQTLAAAAVISSTPPPSSPLLQILSHSSGHKHQRSQRIQNFFQQQIFHHQQFHTQHNHNLCSKQKQTQFAMSSLAAEPLALQQKDEHKGGHQASDDESSSTSAKAASSATPSKPHNSTSGKPCFNAGLGDIIQFMELIGNLKHTKRTGWVLRDVNDCESISGHMYRMSILTFLLDGTEGLNQIRCMELALVHDLAESLVGDITPFCGVSKEEKKAMELKAMEDICKLIEPRGKRMMELFEEYEHGESPESRFVKDLDRLDMVMQAFEYEKRDNCILKHQEFFDSTEGKFNHPFVKTLVNEIYEQREKLAKAKGATPPPKVEVPNMDNPQTHAAKPQTNGQHHIEKNVETSKTS